MKKIKRLLFENFTPTSTQITIENDPLLHRIKNVLRFTTGDHVIFFNHQGYEAISVITFLANNKLIATIKEIKHSPPANSVIIDMYCAMIKKQRFELALEKLTELGVHSITPLITDRTIVRIDSLPTRFLTIMTEASEQAHLSVPPLLHNPITFTEALTKIDSVVSTKILLEPTAQMSLATISQSTHYSLFIGPEGGFSPEELVRAQEHHCALASLPLPILRAETAALIGASALLLRK